ncbi:ORF 73; extensive acidic domains, potential leucine zipper; immediate early protein homolog [hydrothermal vent metagenome]|uniref:ORF 73 extensive acidic domains, potential leucine zipper immediate early protein homolog n=1 Tax=hydrothermal vent metagenome TaxID=652676 RepID=A0A1W1EIP2_9ZZZZ
MSHRENELLQDNKSTSPQLGEHELAINITSDASQIMQKAEAQVGECMLLLDKDLKNLKEHKESLKSEALDESQKLLLDLGFKSYMLKDEPEIEFEYEDDKEKIEVRTPSSGKFTSFLLSSVIGFIITIASLFTSAKSIGVTFDLNRLTDFNYLGSILKPIGELFTEGATANIGAIALVIFVLIIMCAIYTIRVSLIAKKNLKDAEEIHEKAEFYCSSKEECKKEMDKIDAHLNEIIKTIGYFKLLLSEQNAKLRRILFIEERQIFDFYHHKSQFDIENTQKLVDAINNLLTTPMAEKGRLSKDAQEALVKSKSVINTQFQNLYDNDIDDILK